MSKKYFSSKTSQEDLKNLANNTTILERLSPKSILNIVSHVVPQCKSKIENLLSNSNTNKLNKQKVLSAVAMFLATTTLLVGASGCSSRTSTTQATQQKTTLNQGSIEDFAILIQKYEKAQQANDKKTMKALNDEVISNNYYQTIWSEIEKSMIEKLGYNPDEVEFLIGRNGVFLVDKTRSINTATFDNLGNISKGIMIRDKEGNVIPIPSEMKEIIEKRSIDLSVQNGTGFKSTYNLYTILNSTEISDTDHDR